MQIACKGQPCTLDTQLCSTDNPIYEKQKGQKQTPVQPKKGFFLLSFFLFNFFSPQASSVAT